MSYNEIDSDVELQSVGGDGRVIIKKFLAKSEKDAIEMAKNELGNNAIVMNIKKVKPKGLAKLFVRGKVEVTAALDETPLYSQEEAAKEKRPVEAGKFSEAEKKADAPDNSSLEERISMLQAHFGETDDAERRYDRES